MGLAWANSRAASFSGKTESRLAGKGPGISPPREGEGTKATIARMHDPGKVGTGFPIRIMRKTHDPGKVGTGFPKRIMCIERQKNPVRGGAADGKKVGFNGGREG